MHSSLPGTLPRDVGGPSDFIDQSKLIYGQQVVTGASNDAPLPPHGLPGNRVLFVAAEAPHDLGMLFLTAGYRTYCCQLHGGGHLLRVLFTDFSSLYFGAGGGSTEDLRTL